MHDTVKRSTLQSLSNEDLTIMGEDIANYKIQFSSTAEKRKEDSIIEGGGKGSYRWKLGSYETLKPLIFYWLIVKLYLAIALPENEPINIPMSRKFLMQSEVPVFLISGLYVLFSLVWGPRLMKDRKPVKLKAFMQLYNLVQVVFCSYIYYETGRLSWFQCLGLKEHDPELRETPCNFRCEPEDRLDTPFNRQMANVAYLYLVAKFLDLFDTIFFVLQKKWSHISLLHVFHHGGMFYGVWYFSKYIGSGHNTFCHHVNSSVHVVLYLYYFLALLGPSVQKYLWWKKYVTLLQLGQFVLGIFFVISGLTGNCNLNIHYMVISLLFVLAFFFLFLDFYIHEYAKKDKKKLAETGDVTNEATEKLKQN